MLEKLSFFFHEQSYQCVPELGSLNYEMSLFHFKVLRFKWAHNFSPLLSFMDDTLLVSVSATRARVCVYVHTCSNVFCQGSRQARSICVQMLTPSGAVTVTSVSPVPGIDRYIYLALCATSKTSSTDAAAELISSKSMTKSLRKHFYLCVCLCG